MPADVALNRQIGSWASRSRPWTFRRDAGDVVNGLKLKNSVGPAAQVGFDDMIDEHRA